MKEPDYISRHHTYEKANRKRLIVKQEAEEPLVPRRGRRLLANQDSASKDESVAKSLHHSPARQEASLGTPRYSNQ